jgi:hypothetical protein
LLSYPCQRVVKTIPTEYRTRWRPTARCQRPRPRRRRARWAGDPPVHADSH